MSTTSVSPSAPGSEKDVTGRLDSSSRVRAFAILAILVLYTEVVSLQYTMVAAALRPIAASFPGAGANLTWALIVFGLVGAGAAPLIGKMSDLWGKKRLLLCCAGAFIIGSTISAITTSWALFLVGRGLQALAIPMLVIVYGLIRDLMPRQYVAVGIGIASTGLGVASLAAPLLGGYLVEHSSWRAIFWFLVGYSVLLTPLVLAFVPETRLRVRERLDITGGVLLGVGLGLCLLYLDKGQDWGWSAPTSWGWLAGGVALLVLFVIVERRAAHPIVDMKLLLAPRVSVAMVIALFSSVVIAIQSYAIGYMTQVPSASELKGTVGGATAAAIKAKTGQALPGSLINVDLKPGYSYGQGLTLLEYGTHVAIWQSLAAMLLGFLAGAWTARSGGRKPMILAATVLSGTSVAYALLPHTGVVFFAVSAVFGIGFGAFYASGPNLIIEAVPQEQQGISAGMMGVMMSVGTAIGLAVVTAFLNDNPVKAAVTVAGKPAGTSVIPQIYTDRGYELGFYFAAGCGLIALVAALAMKHGRTPATGGTAH